MLGDCSWHCRNVKLPNPNGISGERIKNTLRPTRPNAPNAAKQCFPITPAPAAALTRVGPLPNRKINPFSPMPARNSRVRPLPDSH